MKLPEKENEGGPKRERGDSRIVIFCWHFQSQSPYLQHKKPIWKRETRRKSSASNTVTERTECQTKPKSKGNLKKTCNWWRVIAEKWHKIQWKKRGQHWTMKSCENKSKQPNKNHRTMRKKYRCKHQWKHRKKGLKHMKWVKGTSSKQSIINMSCKTPKTLPKQKANNTLKQWRDDKAHNTRKWTKNNIIPKIDSVPKPFANRCNQHQSSPHRTDRPKFLARQWLALQKLPMTLKYLEYLILTRQMWFMTGMLMFRQKIDRFRCWFVAIYWWCLCCSQVYLGAVKSYNDRRGFGFVACAWTAPYRADWDGAGSRD